MSAASDATFIDSNVLIHTDDPRDLRKQEIALAPLLSEDLQHLRRIDGLQILNPFADADLPDGRRVAT